LDNLNAITSIGYMLILVIGFSAFWIPRRYVLLPLIASVCYLSLSQQVVIGDMHFHALRLVIGILWLRIAIRSEWRQAFEWCLLDNIIITYALTGCIVNTILWGSYDAFKYQLGFLYNIFGTYFICRIFIREVKDIRLTIRLTAACMIPLAIGMICESITGKNAFSIFGGIMENAMIRDGHIRCQGPFSHPILAGTAGAVTMPLIIATYYKQPKIWLLFAIFATAAIAVTSRSSGPIMAYGFGILGLLSWKIKNHMRFVRWGIVLSLVWLHFVMSSPVWYTMTRISEIVGGGGWHRAYLIDQAIRYFSDWWLIGTKYTAHWMPYGLELNPESADLTNQFIADGVTGGLAKMLLLIIIIVLCFKRIGKSAKLQQMEYPKEAFMAWCIGASLLVHITTFFSVPYFDQIYVFWYMLLAFVAALPSLEVKYLSCQCR
jgi:hypothetical protein